MIADTLNLTRHVAQFVVATGLAEIPADVVAIGKKSILDGVGLALSGASAESGHLVRRYLQELGLRDGPATVIGSTMRVSPRFAAFANGVGIHADDFDDTQLAVAADRVYGLLMHPTAPALPAALAVAEARGGSGAEAMLAYHLGVEVECKIAEAIAPRHYQAGFHTTGTCGGFGAAAAAAKLLGLDLEGTARALSIAGSQAAGLRENFGTMTKPFHAGKAAENGVAAAHFAAIGWTATPALLEAPRGFFNAAGGGFDEAAIRGKLGDPWTFATPGISIKPHPSGSLTHPGMTEMLRLIREHAIRAEDVVHVRVGTNSHMPNTLIHNDPQNELQAKFSMQYSMAVLLVAGRAGLNEYTDAMVMRPDIRAMMQRIEFGVDAEAEAAGYHKMTTILDIELKDGKHIRGKADFGKGSPSDPMSYEEVADKFLQCAEYAGFPRGKAQTIVAMVAELETLGPVERLMSLLST